jgi:hypothetical protein
MKNTYKKEINFSELKKQIDDEYTEEAIAFHPYDYDGDILVDKNLHILDGYHRTAGLIKHEIESESTVDSINVIVITHGNTAAIVADPNHRLHSKLVDLVIKRV